MGIFNADVIINIPPAFFSLQKSGLVRVYLTSVFLLLSVPRCFGDQKPQFDFWDYFFSGRGDFGRGDFWIIFFSGRGDVLFGIVGIIFFPGRGDVLFGNFDF